MKEKTNENQINQTEKSEEVEEETSITDDDSVSDICSWCNNTRVVYDGHGYLPCRCIEPQYWKNWNDPQ